MLKVESQYWQRSNNDTFEKCCLVLLAVLRVSRKSLINTTYHDLNTIKSLIEDQMSGNIYPTPDGLSRRSMHFLTPVQLA